MGIKKKLGILPGRIWPGRFIKQKAEKNPPPPPTPGGDLVGFAGGRSTGKGSGKRDRKVYRLRLPNLAKDGVRGMGGGIFAFATPNLGTIRDGGTHYGG
jgi:hypothetical protein